MGKGTFKITVDIKNQNLFVDEYEKHFEILREAHKDLLKKKPKPYLYFSYISLCSATLEYSLNSLYVNFCYSMFSLKEYKQYADTFIKMNFKSKLYLSPIIISKHSYKFNEDHTILKDLSYLIERRNRLLHNKRYWKNLETDEKGDFKFEIYNYLESITKEECFKYGRALGKLKDDLFDRFKYSKLVETDLIIKI